MLPAAQTVSASAQHVGETQPDPPSTWPFGQTGSQPAPKSAWPSGHTSAVGVASTQVVLLPNFASSLEHTAEVAVAASQPEPKLAWPSGHVLAVAVALTHPAPKSDRPGGHAASQPAPKS